MKIAVLIDADNACAKLLPENLKKIEEYGSIAIKRVYGDWSRTHLNKWKEYSNKYSLKSIQAYSYVKGKNSTDIAMIIDAMDLLYQQAVDAFCIVSSDCDFTGLIHRIKEDGLFTIGVGNSCACSSFKEACDVFLMESKTVNLTAPMETFKVKVSALPGPKVIGKLDLSKIK